MPRTVMMFCGQGAQYHQMGREVYRTDPVFRREMALCDEIAGDLAGKRVSEAIYGRPFGESEGFDRLAETNPALLAVGWSLAMVLLERGVAPDRLLGYSLGETIAAVVAGVLSLEDGFRLVTEQARLFEAHAPAGAMIAVLAPADAVAPVAAQVPSAEITAVNAPSHCVVSLLAHDAAAMIRALEAAGLVHARLPIRYPFHAAPIEPLAAPMAALARSFHFGRPRWPLLSATTAGEVTRFEGDHLWAVMRGPLRFRETVEALAREGEWTLVEAGPSGTLCAFARQIRAPGIAAWPAIDQFGENERTLSRLVAAVT